MVGTNLPIWIVEGYGVHHIPMPFKHKQLISRICVPHFAGAIIAPCDETTGGGEGREGRGGKGREGRGGKGGEGSERDKGKKRDGGERPHLDPDLLKATLVSGRM
jgi:hypothetical protein